jgi:hypothetical protein
MSYSRNGTLITELDYTVQDPIPSDGDSVYVKDIDFARSDNGDFIPSVAGREGDGTVADYFNSLTTVNCNSTSDNPKIIKVQFQRTIQTARIGFGCDDLTKGFGSNITVKVIGSGDQVRTVATEDVTNPNSFVIDFDPQSANGVIIEFNDSAEICLSNLIIYKSVNVNAKIQAIQDNGTLVDATATDKGNLKVALQEYGDTPAIDAFDRLRISEPYTIFDSKQLHDKQPLFWDEEVGGSATSVHVPADSCTAMTVTANASDYVIRQTKQKFNYQPGKSQLILATFYTQQATGVTSQIGYFEGDTTTYLDPKDGIYLEIREDEIYLNIAKNGVVVESVEQANWNVDKLDGTGASGKVLNLASSQIFIIDFEWLGVGRVRCGFVIDGLITYTHYFNHANDPAFSSVYMQTPNLPMRYTISSDGTGAGVLDHICASVMSEGGLEETGVLRSVDVGNTHLDADTVGVQYAMLGIKLKDAYADVTVLPQAISLLASNNDDFRWTLKLNPTIAGTFTYTDVGNSSIQVATGVTANTVTGGVNIGSGYVAGNQFTDVDISTALRLGSTIDGTQDEIVICINPLTSGLNVFGSMTYRELL